MQKLVQNKLNYLIDTFKRIIVDSVYVFLHYKLTTAQITKLYNVSGSSSHSQFCTIMPCHNVHSIQFFNRLVTVVRNPTFFSPVEPATSWKFSFPLLPVWPFQKHHHASCHSKGFPFSKDFFLKDSQRTIININFDTECIEL